MLECIKFLYILLKPTKKFLFYLQILPFIVSIIIIFDFMEISLADDEVDLVAMKRPFCNAFTGT